MLFGDLHAEFYTFNQIYEDALLPASPTNGFY